MSSKVRTKGKDNTTGWIVTFSGFGVNLALGVLYCWSVFASELRVIGWTVTQTQIPYMVACAVFAILMVPGGMLQDRFGPKPMLIAAAILTGIGLVLSGIFVTLIGVIVSFGVIFGTAMAFGYATTTPTAIKWFGPHRRGLVSGIVVSGFGLAGIYVSPLTTFLLHNFSLSFTFFVLGIFYCVTILLLHFLIKNPPVGYTPKSAPIKKSNNKKVISKDFTWKQMLTTYEFYLIWIMFFCGTFAGLKILGQLSSIGREQAGLTISHASYLIIIYALFNCIGRFSCGILSDKIGRKITLVIIFLIQVLGYISFSQFTNLWTLSFGTAILAFSFGGMLAVFPSLTADYFGVKNLGLNYGIIFTAWGAGGVLGPLLGGMIRDHIGVFDLSYLISAIFCFVGLVLSLILLIPKNKKSTEIVDDVEQLGA